jgi:hypothetical protein
MSIIEVSKAKELFTMTNLREIPVSWHFANERKERKARIDEVINGNWGQVIRESFATNVWHCLTDTGLIFIVNADKSKIMTYYFATPAQAQQICNKSCPKQVLKRIQKNAGKYQKLYNEKVGKWG